LTGFLNRYTLSFVKPNSKRRSKIHKVPAEQVALVLAEHGVRVAVVNACESSKVLESGSMSANMAHVFVRSGLQAAIAMSFNAMDSTAELFIAFLYLKFLVYYEDLATAVANARQQLYDSDSRGATLAENISITDFVVPTLYRSSEFRPE
jgi:hypothetical protein